MAPDRTGIIAHVPVNDNNGVKFRKDEKVIRTSYLLWLSRPLAPGVQVPILTKSNELTPVETHIHAGRNMDIEDI